MGLSLFLILDFPQKNGREIRTSLDFFTKNSLESSQSRKAVPGVSMTLKKWGHYPKLRGHGPNFWTHIVRVMETLGRFGPM